MNKTNGICIALASRLVGKHMLCGSHAYRIKESKKRPRVSRQQDAKDDRDGNQTEAEAPGDILARVALSELSDRREWQGFWGGMDVNIQHEITRSLAVALQRTFDQL